MKTAFLTCQFRFDPIPLFGPTVLWASLFTSALLTLSGCNVSGEITPNPASNSSGGPSATPSEATTTDPEGDSENLEVDPTSSNVLSGNTSNGVVAADDGLISAQGIGPAQLGMTVGSLKQVLGEGVEFNFQSPFLTDFDAIAVQQDDQTLFYLLYLAGDPLEDGDVIQGILTTNPRYQTEAGVGVGTPIQTAEVAYGNATLSHNTDNESREYVRFEQHPATNISFTTQPVILAADADLPPFAGTYTSPVIQYNETEEYRADASVQAVLLVCLAVSCSQGQE
ncbi:MAG: hypothetical protein F6K30_28125 [Cyanothece sp. SIO2G6]|nr:hypothetical protein [Cyanothece sp. SIO2G6]